MSEKDLREVMANVVFLASVCASVNTGFKNGLNLFRDEMSWVGFVWCFSHRVELALTDALCEWGSPIAKNLQKLYSYMKSQVKNRGN